MGYELGMDRSYDIQAYQSKPYPHQRSFFEICDRKSRIIGRGFFYRYDRGCDPDLKIHKVRITTSGTLCCTIP
jgi:hypothetical protein